MTYFRQYLIGRQFTLLTDQIVLKYLKRKDEPLGVIAAYALESLEFDYIVQHVPGKKHVVPDFMSRISAREEEPDLVTFENQERVYMPMFHRSLTCSATEAGLGYEEWKKGQEGDSKISAIYQILITNQPECGISKFHTLKNNLVAYCDPRKPSLARIVVPITLRWTLFEIMHEHFGHRGVKPVLHTIAGDFYWPRMAKDIRKWNRACLECRRRKTTRPLHAGLTRTIHASKPGELLLIDFIGGTKGGSLPKSPEGYCHLLIAMDCFTRYTFAIMLRTLGEEEIAEGLMREVIVHIGLPRAVHSDNAKVLIGGAVRRLYRKLGVRPSSITFRHPQGNSPVERFMRYLNSAFTITLPDYSAWSSMVPLILFVYQTLPHETTGFSPFFMMFGREPLLPLAASIMPSDEYSLEDGPDAKGYVERMSHMLVNTFKIVRRRQQRASEQNAERRDEKRTDVRYEMSDPVLYYDPVAVSGLTSSTRPSRPEKDIQVPGKWKFPWSGPHPIVGKRSDNVYLIYHQQRKLVISVNVDSLSLYHPFSPVPWDPDVPEESINPEIREKHIEAIEIEPHGGRCWCVLVVAWRG